MRKISFELTLEDIKQSHLTLTLIGINVFIFFIFNIILEDPVILAQENYKIMNGEKLWSLFTSILVHLNFTHLFSNILGLLVFGSVIEKFYSRSQFLTIYITSGIVGSIFSYLLNSPGTTGMGASGAIFGIMACVFLKIPKEDKFVYIYGIIYIGFAIGSSPENWAHIFGLFCGFLIGFIIKFIDKKKKDKNHSTRKYYY